MSDLQQGCAPSECGTKPACAGCSHNHNQAAEEVKKEPPKVRKVIGVVSGKGGVGKSLVSGELAVSSAAWATASACLTRTSPARPSRACLAFTTRPLATASVFSPAETEKGIEVMSINLMLDSDDAPVIWRGPVIAGAVKQFWEDVAWGELDVMVIDMPPGTGDVPLTIFQSLPVDGIVVVTSPQDLVSMIVSKALKMANMMHIPVLAIVENMSSVKCPDCGKEIPIFGESKLSALAEKFGIEHTARIPIDPKIAAAVDSGKIETDRMRAAARHSRAAG